MLKTTEGLQPGNKTRQEGNIDTAGESIESYVAKHDKGKYRGLYTMLEYTTILSI